MPIRSRNIESAGSVTDAGKYRGIENEKLREDHERHADVTITSAQVLALNATPVTVVAAPGAGKAIIFTGAVLATAGGTAYGGIAATEDLAFRYTDGSGIDVAHVEATGWLDQTTAQVRFALPQTGALAEGTISSFVPVADAALVAHMAVGEITTGNYAIKMRVFYRIVPTTVAGIV